MFTGRDGLEGPTSIAVRNGTVYIPSAAYILKTDPNLITAHLRY